MEQLSMRALKGVVSLTSSQGSNQSRDFEQYANNSLSDSGILNVSGTSMPDPHLQQIMMNNINDIFAIGRIEEMNEEQEESKVNFELKSKSNLKLQKMAKMIKESKIDVENVHSFPSGIEVQDDGSEEQFKMIKNFTGKRSSLKFKNNKSMSCSLDNSAPKRSNSISNKSNKFRPRRNMNQFHKSAFINRRNENKKFSESDLLVNGKALSNIDLGSANEKKRVAGI